MPAPLQLRGERPPARLVMVRMGRSTLTDERLEADCKATFNRWGLFGSSVFGLGDGGYPELARYVPILPERQWVMEARTFDLLDDGFPLLATNDHPHWTIVFAEPTAAHFVRARRHFSQPVQNPVWVERR